MTKEPQWRSNLEHPGALLRPFGRGFDPTAEPRLQQLLQETLAQRNVGHLLLRLRRIDRVSLVLSGGGGKGAYEAGVLLALFDCGLTEMSCLAGTSVGGLNAALYHQMCSFKKRDLALQVWSEISLSKIMTFNWRSLLKLVTYIPLGFRRVDEFRSPGDDSRDPAWYSSQPSGNETITDFLRILFVDIVVLLTLTPVLMLAFFIYIYLTSLLFRFLFGSFDGQTAIQSLKLFTYLVSVTVILPRLAMIISRATSIASNQPLKELISANVSTVNNGHPPVIIVLADPVRGPLNLVKERLRRPIYLSLGDCNTLEEAIDLLVQTAAIPEIFPMRPIGGRFFVDGGIADNTPILSVFASRPSVVIVVYLDHQLHFRRTLDQDERKRIGAIVNLAESHEWNYWKIQNWIDQTKFIRIIPSTKLGARPADRKTCSSAHTSKRRIRLLMVCVQKTFDYLDYVTGDFRQMLDFRSKTARNLMAQGYEDALRQIRQAASLPTDDHLVS